MVLRILFFVLVVLYLARAHPTMYKLNENKVLEAELIPVSSTVIPLPIYQVGYGINVRPGYKEQKVFKPEGPVSLITAHSKKKMLPTHKTKHEEEPIPKQPSNE